VVCWQAQSRAEDFQNCFRNISPDALQSDCLALPHPVCVGASDVSDVIVFKGKIMTRKYDVIVLGGGIVGASTAYDLVKRGQRVLVIEQFEPGHKRGSSHGDGRVVRFNYPESIYVEMAMLAYPAWEDLSARAGRAVWQKTGLIEYGPAGCAPIQESEANLKRYGLAYEILDAEQAGQRFPQFRFAQGTTILYQAEGAVAFATPAVLALWRLLREGGADTLTGCRVEHIQASADGVHVQAEGVDVWAERLVVAVGGWAKPVLAQLGLDVPLVVTQEVLAYYAVQEVVSHRIGDQPVMIDFHTSDAFYTLPQVDVPGIKVGWHHKGRVVDADHPKEAPQETIAGISDWVRGAYRYAAAEPFEISTCLYTNTPDYHFILDRHPVHENVVIGGGFSGHGFKFGPTLGNLLGSLAMGETPALPLDAFSLKRFAADEPLQRRTGA
jgi:monomeric sarcosine oxidase